MITLNHCGMDNWFALTDEHTRRINGADIEGDRDEWMMVADAIDRGESISFKRCAARRSVDGWSLSSPRNSTRSTDVTCEQAIAIAAEIRRVIAETPIDITPEER